MLQRMLLATLPLRLLAMPRVQACALVRVLMQVHHQQKVVLPLLCVAWQQQD